MGSYLSRSNMCNKQSTTCTICAKKVDSEISVLCIRCNIVMHTECYDANKNPNNGYTTCPNCNKVGVLGTNKI